MAERKNGSFSPPAIGGSSLLVVFAVLCLTVFALLSLSTVRADVRLAESARQAVADYYAADGEAQEILARLRAGEEPDGVAVFPVFDDDRTAWCEYAVPISDTQELRVTAELKGQEYRILQWQAVPVGDWEPDLGLDLWDGLPF